MVLMEIIVFWVIRIMSTIVLVCIFLIVIFLALLFLSRMRKAKHLTPLKSENANHSPEQRGANTNHSFLLFDLNLPFRPDVHDVIYVENEYDPAINGFIQEHLRKSNNNSFQKRRLSSICQSYAAKRLPKKHFITCFPFLGRNPRL